MPPAINDFFHPRMHRSDGSVHMVEHENVGRDRLYILNHHGIKLLQLRLKNEVEKTDASYCQLKIIFYKIRHALVYRDMPDDPLKINLHDDLELTYHGGRKGDAAPKVHVKAKLCATTCYTTLVDSSLPLDSRLPQPAPIFSLETGYAFNQDRGDTPKKKSHLFTIDYTEPTRIDFYLAGRDMDYRKFMESMFMLNLLWTPDFLIQAKGGVLQSHPIVKPITAFTMGGYSVWARASVSKHCGRPYLQFYNNADYYRKFSNRRMAWQGENGELVWSTLAERLSEVK
ncbi:MAG: hypothetical protein PHP95_14055 [Desulfuromonadaceae bacterium]|nr:hypothetical protein [Desulfuromonadaceae bacterium]MDD2849572.1 hypothetical protein [Desulfuromonadaceae bacterium]MDD4131998.1 hypothetical protein [Desulfuromonadaceae bacterium]